ncbi:MAG: hypothetical protein ABFS32_12670 [Bacteroidota bacterium]
MAQINFLIELHGDATDYTASSSWLNLSSGGNAVDFDTRFKGIGATYTTSGVGVNFGLNEFTFGGTINHTKTLGTGPLLSPRRVN